MGTDGSNDTRETRIGPLPTGLCVDTAKVNAYVTGLGNSKRIVLWDTLIARLSPVQVKSVVGHELGHYVLGHVWTSVILSTVLTFIGLWIASAGREGPSESHATSSFKQQFKNSIQAIEIIA
jgi:Zn-dependent protease with chaperone function